MARLITATLCLLFVTVALADPIRRLAPLLASETSETIENSYIVVFKKDASADVLQTHFNRLNTLILSAKTKNANDLEHTFNMDSFKGYSGKFDPQVLEEIRSADEVDYVEKDSMVYASEIQRSAPWGLARVSNRKRLTFSNFNKYEYDATNAGEGVTVYVIDTGINIQHVDFEGRAEWGFTAVPNDQDVDGNGHGTHCAGSVAGAKHGVAKKAKLVAVKVLGSNGSGTMAGVVKGVEWTADAHKKAEEEAKKSGQKRKGSVANMSLGGGKSPSLDAAVNSAVDSGIVFAVAAGNDNRDACNNSPAAAEKAITVGASTIGDERAYFSNWGTCVDVFAPGLNILSTWIGSRTATNTISGTSMASPHVAGLSAYFLGEMAKDGATVTAKQVKDKVLALATKGALSSIGTGSPNLLIYNNFNKEA